MSQAALAGELSTADAGSAELCIGNFIIPMSVQLSAHFRAWYMKLQCKPYMHFSVQ